ncbi:SCO family protein [Novosphingobium sp. 1949]|uniref:SCO family protein n=1 Tax=Novosphingobium organovorum TaxID=2930092 RepID=A0ABT0BG73_9SPHN|nr:SCO family protein [Novosphingobium organovorum]MCJ2183858.1 SCO family protein [Novosphingobium organovorum]
MTHLRFPTARRLPRRLFIAASLGLALAACQPTEPAHAPIDGVDITGADIGGPFTLVDKTGKTVRWQDFRGKWVMLYFGYTFCPDACPVDVQVMMKAYDQFAKSNPAAAAKIQPVFISIDPARDTPAVVGEWTAAFSPRLMGLTGSEKQTNLAADAFAVIHSKGEATPGGGYLMNHSRFVYLMDPKGKPVDMLPVDKGADAVAGDLAKLVS